MPLYRKSVSFERSDLNTMSVHDCNDLLLCLRYLKFRNDKTLSDEEYDKRINILENHITEQKSKSMESLYAYIL
jgi:hypothetical protein